MSAKALYDQQEKSIKRKVANMSDAKTPQLLDVQLVSSGWLNKYELTYRAPDGSTLTYESVSRKGLKDYVRTLEANARGDASTPDAVCIVPILPDGSIMLIREFRYPVNAWCIAFPAGLMEKGETLEDCVTRELCEETGCRVRTDLGGEVIRPLPQSGYSSVGMSEENVHVVIAQVERAGEAQPERNELIETFTLARGEIASFLESNKDLIGTRCQLMLEAMKTQGSNMSEDVHR